nr:PDZ domain-containing protein 11-like [Ciona intestinalis]|eukprot:XP_002126321.1 PDZ domain-containing protein 11-like [Ciona intestinalis]
MSKSKQKKNKTKEDPNLPAYENPPSWIPPQERRDNPQYNNNLITFLPRTVSIKRTGNQPLGFNIRGGKKDEYGVYVSKVLKGSDADKLGLKSGDKILKVNNTSFEDIGHDEAVSLLQKSDDLQLEVRYFPYGFNLQQERIGLV